MGQKKGRTQTEPADLGEKGGNTELATRPPKTAREGQRKRGTRSEREPASERKGKKREMFHKFCPREKSVCHMRRRWWGGGGRKNGFVETRNHLPQIGSHRTSSHSFLNRLTGELVGRWKETWGGRGRSGPTAATE